MAQTSQSTTNRRVTRDDVARLAGVSPAVVSYVINNSKFVSEEKVIAVRKAIEELQYRPNMQARGLKMNRSMQIAFVCDNLMNYWLADAEKYLFENGYYVSHCYSRDGDDFIDMLIARQFDGVFMMSNRYSTSQLNRLAKAGIPVVLYIELSAHRIADTICEATGAKPMLLHSAHNVTAAEFEAGATYVSLMRANLDTLRAALY